MNLPKLSGIYRIRNTTNNHSYVGSAVNLSVRQNTHLRALRGGTHHSPHLNRAWVKYGEADFVFELLELCDKNDLLEREQWWFDNSHAVYNVCRVAGSTLGVRLSQQQKALIAERTAARIKAKPDAHAEITKKANAAIRELLKDENFVAQKRIRNKATALERLALKISWNGEVKTLEQWAATLGCNESTLKTRLQRWSLEDAMTTPFNGRGVGSADVRSARAGKQVYLVDGCQLTITQAASALHTSRQSLFYYSRKHGIAQAVAHYKAKI